jgi:hypothetical protein
MFFYHLKDLILQQIAIKRVCVQNAKTLPELDYFFESKTAIESAHDRDDNSLLSWRAIKIRNFAAS